MKVIVCKGCGARIQGVKSDGSLACPICIGIEPESGIPVEVEMPDEVECIYCRHKRKTSQELPFLDAKTKTYYCGCRGWD